MNDPFEIDAALQESESDLDLLAFCYLTDDLSPVAKEAFELRLATDQPAREALARAVELSTALKPTSRVELNHAVSTPAHSSGSVAPRAFDRWMRVTSYVAIAFAACWAVVIGIRAIPRANPLQSPETALVWSQVRDSWSEVPVAQESDAAVAAEGEVESLGDEPVEDELSSDMPAWLMTAVDGPADNDVPSTE